MYALENDKLKISVKKIGAELCEIASIKHKTQFMWDANPDIWGSFAPNLFPIIGGLKNGEYQYKNKTYRLPKHGFIRHNKSIILDSQTNDSLTFKLIYNDALLEIYPFKFEFLITYKLVKNTLNVTHTIKNLDAVPMYFSLGGHPAFKCPVFNDENYNDYYLEFEHIENSKTHAINTDNGLANSETKPGLENTDKLPLHRDLFIKDALIFKDLKSKSVTLKSKDHGAIISVKYPDFNYLGIWAKPKGDYVCIEPWLGITDYETTNQDFTTKEGIIKLNAKNMYTAAYTIEIHDNHLN